MLSGRSDRGCGLTLGAGGGRLGLGRGGFPLEEVVGHLQAQSTCFSWAPGAARRGEAATLGVEPGAGSGVRG